MSTNACEPNAQAERGLSPVLELRVRNHPGVMSHICGLFARRAYNVEKILCIPIGNGEQSMIWLTVDDKGRLDQIVNQAMKLEDVCEVRMAGREKDVFGPIEALLFSPPPSVERPEAALGDIRHMP